MNAVKKTGLIRRLFSIVTANRTLFIAVLLTIFIIPLLPSKFYSEAYNLLFTAILLIGTQLVSGNRKLILGSAILAIFMVWLADVLDMNEIKAISKGINVILFMFIVFDLVKQVSMARKVSPKVILESINGYLMIGLVFAVMVALTAVVYPGSYSPGNGTSFPVSTGVTINGYIYYAFMTLTTTGYGDIVPLTAAARSLAILIAVTGQLYVTIVIALLIGKYLTQDNTSVTT